MIFTGWVGQGVAAVWAMPWDAKTAARSATQRWSERNVIAYLLQIVDKKTSTISQLACLNQHLELAPFRKYEIGTQTRRPLAPN
ncbi:hypothetical protein [Variovorax sp. ZT4R33]|uniref:hypothetical protein n=1 Tax=Variovorax sp. ZT4R33 TaxID=3443743 RepID=UPI003F479472